ncbi:unnamed protein product [Pedinophyceae sp. YPF-701]|nr:unnamed protein product [Pedinophyceae sp. YPF-701]
MKKQATASRAPSVGWLHRTVTALFATALLSALVPPALAAVIAAGKLEKCVRDGASLEVPIECQEKLIVTVAVENGNTLETEQLEVQLSCVNSPDGQCPCSCNYATDPGCICRDVQDTFTVTLTKSPIYASYPLEYVKSFPGRAIEGIVRTGSGADAGQCEAGALSSNPTCGWIYDKDGDRVEGSQGFCCECGASKTVEDTFGKSDDRIRANVNCDLFGGGLFLGGVPGSAHCLYFDQQWYQGFAVGEAGLRFDLTVRLRTNSSDFTDAGGLEELVLGPSQPYKVSERGLVSAKLLGDLAGYDQLPVLSERYLMVPDPADGDILTMATQRIDEWVLLDKSMVSVSGRECDKAGTSFEAFASQANACGRLPGSCLNGQILDLIDEDNERIAEGRTPLYKLRRYMGGKQLPLDVTDARALRLQLPVDTLGASVVSLDMLGDSVRLVVNSSPARIVSAKVCQFANVECGGFEALTERGYLTAEVENEGYIDAGFTISVHDCSENVREVEARRADIRARSEEEFVFELFVEDDRQVEQRGCNVTVQDSQGQVTDTLRVTFFTNATDYTENIGASRGDENFDGAYDARTDPSCADMCNLLDLICSFVKGCWTRFFLGLLTIGLIIGGIYLLYLSIRRGWCLKAARALGVAATGTKEEREEMRAQTDRRRQKLADMKLSALDMEYAQDRRGGRHGRRRRSSHDLRRARGGTSKGRGRPRASSRRTSRRRLSMEFDLRHTTGGMMGFADTTHPHVPMQMYRTMV